MGKRLVGAFAVDDPERFAQLLGAAQEIEETIDILNRIPDGCEAEVLAHLNPGVADRLLSGFPEGLLAAWLSTCPPEAGRRLLSRMGRTRAMALIEKVEDPGRRRWLRRIASWPPGTIGATMHGNSLAIAESRTAAEVEEIFRERQDHRGGYAFVVNAEERVVGVLDLAAIVANEDKAALAAEFCVPLNAVHAESPLESLLESDAWQRRNTLPVVDFQDRLVGYISQSDVAAVLGMSSPGSLFLESAVELSARYMQFLAYSLTFFISRRSDR